MSEEIPEANPPLSAEEQVLVSRLSDAHLQAIDATILGSCSDRWQKVAKVVGLTLDALKNKHPNLSYVFYAERLALLVDERRLESQGNVSYIRFSEVRLPTGEP